MYFSYFSILVFLSQDVPFYKDGFYLLNILLLLKTRILHKMILISYKHFENLFLRLKTEKGTVREFSKYKNFKIFLFTNLNKQNYIFCDIFFKIFGQFSNFGDFLKNKVFFQN